MDRSHLRRSKQPSFPAQKCTSPHLQLTHQVLMRTLVPWLTWYADRPCTLYTRFSQQRWVGIHHFEWNTDTQRPRDRNRQGGTSDATRPRRDLRPHSSARNGAGCVSEAAEARMHEAVEVGKRMKGVSGMLRRRWIL